MMKKRLAFCKKYLKWTPTQWENGMFSDESTFHLVNSSGTKVRRARGISRCKQRYTITLALCFMRIHGAKFFLQDGAT
jgi:hypothetical protein